MGYLPAIVATIALGVSFQWLLPTPLRTLDYTGLATDWSQYTSLTADLKTKCKPKHPDLLKGCEDIHVVENAMFAVCVGDFYERSRWSVAMDILDMGVLRENGGSGLNARVVRWDLTTDKAEAIPIEGYPADLERAFIAFDVNVLSPTSYSFYIINHLPTGSVIQKFAYNPETTILTYITTLPYLSEAPGAPRPNDVFAIPSLDSENAVFVTNDYHSKAGTLIKKIEQVTTKPWGWLSYYSTSTGWKVAADKLAGANGLTGTKGDTQNERLYLSELGGGKIIAYDRSGAEIKEIQRVDIGLMGDNPSLSHPDQKDLYIAIHVNPLDLRKHLLNFGTEKAPPAGSMVRRFNTAQLGSAYFGGKGETSDPIVETVFVDRYSELTNSSSTALFVKYPVKEEEENESVKREDEDEDEEEEKEVSTAKGDLYITGLTSEGILKCENMEA